MKTSRMSRFMLMGLAMLLGSLSVLAWAQTALIYACVDQQGRLTVIAPGGTCGARERLITWPAEPTGSVSYDQRSAVATLRANPQTVVALCAAPDETATGGGYRFDPNPHAFGLTGCWVNATVSCRASGLCAGPAGEDGWLVEAWDCTSGSLMPVLHVYVTCSQP